MKKKMMKNTTITVDKKDKLKFMILLNKYRKIDFNLNQDTFFGILVKVMKEYDCEIGDLIK